MLEIDKVPLLIIRGAAVHGGPPNDLAVIAALIANCS